jgi:hypothetical protein
MVDIVYFKNRGDVSPESILVENDCCSVVRDIQNIDKDYFVVFNPNNQKFELHHTKQPDSSYCLTFPFDELDGRAVEHTRRTSATRARTLFEEMKAHNERLEREKNNRLDDEISWKAKEIYTHCIRHGVDGDFDDGAFSTKWN